MSFIKKKKTIGRRTILRGMLGGAAVGVALPTLEAAMNESGTAYADGGGFPCRYLTWFWGNGVHREGWTPPAAPTVTDLTDEAYEWMPLSMPLIEHAAKMALITGFNVRTSGQIPHESAAAGMLSGASLLVTDERNIWQQPSIDQLIAAEVGGDTLYPSLHVAGTDFTKSISYKGPDAPNPSEPSAFKVYQDLFGDSFRAPGEGGVVDPRLALRRSVLDAVGDDARRLQSRLGRADRQRIEQHFTAIREIERRLLRLEQDPPNYAACERPEMPPETIGLDDNGRPRVQLRNQIMAELTAMAFACDQTRVMTYLLTPPVSDVVFPIDELDLVVDDGTRLLKGHHDLTHNEPDDDMPRVRAIFLYIMDRLAEFVRILDSIPEGDATLLDNSLVLATTDSSNPRLHSLEDFPIVLFGGAGGRVKMGSHVHSPDDNSSKVLMTIARAMGLNRASIGMEDAETTEGVTALEP
jgi:hypothetical protein